MSSTSVTPTSTQKKKKNKKELTFLQVLELIGSKIVLVKDITYVVAAA